MLNLQGRAGLFAIVNLIQDVGWLHALHLEIKQPKNLGWVFTRQKLSMQKYPGWNEEITIHTWLRPPGKDPFLYRDYELFMGAQKIGECTSTFAVMNLETRKLAPQDWSQYPDVWRSNGCLSSEPSKVPYDANAKELAILEVRNSDIDVNAHVNNTRYVQWIIDAVPMQHLRSRFSVSEYDINFLAEAKLGNTVRIEQSMENSESTSGIVYFQGILQENQKVAFTCRMRYVER